MNLDVLFSNDFVNLFPKKWLPILELKMEQSGSKICVNAPSRCLSLSESVAESDIYKDQQDEKGKLTAILFITGLLAYVLVIILSFS